ncbi:hypothetical protein J6590_033984 [Homalodisca vitripennis]|nr:hypothetical protein J6590_033984 [Homalodisca vitripennis]
MAGLHNAVRDGVARRSGPDREPAATGYERVRPCLRAVLMRSLTVYPKTVDRKYRVESFIPSNLKISTVDVINGSICRPYRDDRAIKLGMNNAAPRRAAVFAELGNGTRDRSSIDRLAMEPSCLSIVIARYQCPQSVKNSWSHALYNSQSLLRSPLARELGLSPLVSPAVHPAA